MCGIFLSLSPSEPILPDPPTLKLLKERGPDADHHVAISIPINGVLHDGALTEVHAVFLSSVLALRGESTVEQPLRKAECGSILCWNGEAWRFGNSALNGNDTEQVLDLLSAANGSESDQSHEEGDPVIDRIRSIRGPYAFVFYDAPRQRIIFGRDCLGRRSLLRKCCTGDNIVLSSICTRSEQWKEVDADGVYIVQFVTVRNVRNSSKAIALERNEFYELYHVPHVYNSRYPPPHLHMMLPFPIINKSLPDVSVETERQTMSTSADVLQAQLKKSMHVRLKDLRQDFRDRMGREHSVQPSKLAILFSGGLDCTVLARLAHDILPPSESVDLLNVAFENPRVHKSAVDEKSSQSAYELCPDRITARASTAELRRLCPGRTWRLVEINVPYVETIAHRDEVLKLMYPHNTEMDLSISYAFYFASKGVGVANLSTKGSPTAYTSPARVLLSGFGADELFGGYQRHTTAFDRLGFEGLIDELELDMSRLGKRNLGRDDRVISHWGKEVRFPYLDEDFLAWALSIPVWQKCGFHSSTSNLSDRAEEDLAPEKRVLRLVARNMGLAGAAKEKKRAIQFGARTAKMTSGKVRGTQLLS